MGACAFLLATACLLAAHGASGIEVPMTEVSSEVLSEREVIASRCTLGEFETAGGIIYFSQLRRGGPTSITGLVTGVAPGLHGWHIHEKGITPDDDPCGSAGGHFNPLMQDHGGPDSKVRHFGDLGNFEADAFGIGVVKVEDELVSLIGPADRSVIGRTLVIHEDEDDLGLGGDAESLRTGNAGARIGCCVITEV